MADRDRDGFGNDGGYGRREGPSGPDPTDFQGFAQDTGLGGTEWQGDSRWGSDEHYLAVRNRFQQQLDRDYDAFRRDRAERFQREFDQWRQECRQRLDAIRKGMEVVDFDGTRVGTVDKVEGGHVKLTPWGEEGRHRYLTPTWIAAVDDKVRLKGTIDEAKRLWRTMVRPEERGRRRREIY